MFNLSFLKYLVFILSFLRTKNKSRTKKPKTQIMLTGNKDVDRKILNELDDKDLVNVCQTNKKAQSLCNDQVFWMNRVFQRFGYVGGDVLRTNKEKYWPSWSEYYIKDLRKINSSNGDEYLIDGSMNNRLDHMIISLNIGANIHARNDIAVKMASKNGHLDIVKYLVSEGANIRARDDIALMYASSGGHIDVVKYLVSNGANIHTKDDNPLRGASSGGHIEVVKYLVGLGADIHAKYDEALRYSSNYGHIEVVKYLVELKPNGANIHGLNDEAMKNAVRKEHWEVYNYLRNNKTNEKIYPTSTQIR